MRAVDSIILPLNTTQYAKDFTGYLAKSVFSKKYDRKSTNSFSFRIEAIAQKFEYNITFGELAHAIAKVQNASVALDVQADTAVTKLAKLLPSPSSHGPHHHSMMRRAVWKIKRFFGFKPKCHGARFDAAHIREYEDDEVEHRHSHHSHHHNRPHAFGHPKPHLPIPPKKLKELKEVLLEIRSINKKLAGFEKGMLSEEGLSGREWYLHKG